MMATLKILGMVAGLLGAQAAQAWVVQNVERVESEGYSIFKRIENVKITLDPNQTLMDVLFVVDDSGSMDTHQKNISANIKSLVGILKGTDADIQAGVVSTTNEPGATHYRNNEGKLVGTNKIARSSDSNFEAILSKNLLVGTGGSGSEKPFDSALSALTEPNTSVANAGFLRPDANLAIVLVTDAEDQSNISPEDFVLFMNNLKGNVAGVSLSAVYIPSTVQGCARDDANAKPKKIEEALTKMNSKSAGLCDPNYAASLGKIGESIRDLFTRKIPLSTIPDEASIQVVFGSVVLPKGDAHLGWAYDAAQQAIMLGDKIDWNAQAKGTQLVITYTTK